VGTNPNGLIVRPPGFEPGTYGLRVGGGLSGEFYRMVKVLVTATESRPPTAGP
jgi:hypothetical protein